MKNKMSIFIMLGLIMGILFSIVSTGAGETAEIAFNGSLASRYILKNIDFLDLKDGNPWPKEAVYTSGALEIMKGYGDRNFGRYNNLTKEQALALAYRAAGREAEAQLAAEKFAVANAANVQGATPDKFWANGYYALAVKDGFITQNDFLSLTNSTVASLNLPNLTFVRDAPASRQEFAYYLGKQLQSLGSRGQEKLFNNFNDWNGVDPEKIPYVEDLLTKGILNGDGQGNLRPKESITREQAAAMIKNSVDYLPSTIVSKRYFGTIENVKNVNDKTYPGTVTNRTMDIRNSNGKLHTINTNILTNSFKPVKNELTGENINPPDKDVIILKDGELGNSSNLSPKDRIEYIADSTNTIKFIKVISSKEDTKYVLAQVDNIDSVASTADLFKIVDLDYPNTSLDIESYNFNKNQQLEKYTMKKDVPVYISGVKEDLNSVYPQKVYLFTMINDIVTEIKNVKFSGRGKENLILSGVVEDVNPALKYITLFDEDGATPEKITNTRKLEILSPTEIEITKNNKKARLEDIEPGDRAFARIDTSGKVAALSAIDNYNKKLGKVLYYKTGLLSVEFNDNSQKIFKVASTVPVFEDGIEKGPQAIEAGDRVRLLLRESKDETAIKEISIEGNEHFITDIYKGNLWDYDSDKNTITAENVEVFKQYGFERVAQKGFKTVEVSGDIKAYKDNSEVPIVSVDKNDKGKIIYFAVEKDYLNDEKAIFLAVKEEFESERFLPRDALSFQEMGSNTVSQGEFKMDFRNDTLCVKKDRLVKPQNIYNGDSALVVMNRNFTTKADYAGIVKVDDNVNKALQIFRVKISEIVGEKNFTVYTYSVWNHETNLWEFTSVPKVFEIKPTTRILSTDGVKNNKLFIDYGDASYKDKYAYVISDGVSAIEVNEMDYTNDTLKGKIYDILPEQDVLSTETRLSPTSVKIRNVLSYDTISLIWTSMPDTEIKFEKNSIIIKKGQRITPDDLRINDQLKILKKVDKGLIILVENG